MEKAASRAVVMFKAFWTIYYSTTVLTVHGNWQIVFSQTPIGKKMPTMTFTTCEKLLAQLQKVLIFYRSAKKYSSGDPIRLNRRKQTI